MASRCTSLTPTAPQPPTRTREPTWTPVQRSRALREDHGPVLLQRPDVVEHWPELLGLRDDGRYLQFIQQVPEGFEVSVHDFLQSGLVCVQLNREFVKKLV